MNKKYTIGLDIGTNSVGYAVTYNDNNSVVKKRMKVLGNTDKMKVKKNLIGSVLFEAGETAENRRLKRNTRRRIERRKNRISYLQEFLAEEMNQVDENFFHRLNESFLVEVDKKYQRHPIFGTLEEEVAYHEQYPTIYHLRKELADSNEKADLRLVYLALAHMIKYRGNFLVEGELDTNNIEVAELFTAWVKSYNEIIVESSEGTLDSLDETITIESVLKQPISKAKKAEEVTNLFQQKKNSWSNVFVRLILGLQVNFKSIYKLDEDVKIQFSSESYEDDIAGLFALVGDQYEEVFEAAKRVYEAIILSEILSTKNKDTSAKLSASMIERYEEHAEDLKNLKAFVRKELPDSYSDIFNNQKVDGYAGYILGKVKSTGNKTVTSQEKFYDYLKKQIEKVDTPEAKEFLNKIELETFLRKQRTFDNGVIPYQVHLAELKAVLDNQQEYYPSLKANRAKIEQLLTFRIPYFVGPLANGNSEFAWLVRKSDEPIRPWNVQEVIDYEKSAVEFIERMTLSDTYLPDETVLPKNSMIYQKYMVFNELTKVGYKLNGQKVLFDSELKAKIFNGLFKQKRSVTEKQLLDFLRKEEQLEGIEIFGIEDKFNASYTTYQDLKKIDGLKALMDSEQHIEMFEEIVKVLTIFEDKKMIQKQLEKFSNLLTPEMIKKLSNRKYTGWGRLSYQLINGMRDKESQKTILDFLMDDTVNGRNRNRNLMQLINDDDLSFKTQIEKAQVLDYSEDLEEIVNELPGSPAIKKGILQSLKIVEELVKIMGYKPTNIVIEMARENQTTQAGKKKSKARIKVLKERLGNLKENVLAEPEIDKQDLDLEKVYLYYLQNGRDMYKDEALDFNSLQYYDVDHIIPQSFIKDDSIDNKVLTSSTANRGKLDDVPSEAVVKERLAYWKLLSDAKLISPKKFANLTKRQLTEEDKQGFVNRQLVETRQITKYVAQLLQQQYHSENEAENTKIVLLKSAMISHFRSSLGFYKVRSLNDYHHAHDAYLANVVAHSLLRVYPVLEDRLVYGQYSKINHHSGEKATQEKNFYNNILKMFKKDNIIDGDGVSLWNKENTERQVNRVLYHSQINLVKRTEIQSGQFYNETIYPKGDSDKLIARKEGLDPKKYGGVNSPTIAYAVAITYAKGKKLKPAYAVEGISIMERAAFEKDEMKFLAEKGYEHITKIVKLPKYSLIEFEDGRKRLVASYKELQKGNQLKLTREMTRFLYYASQYEKLKNELKEKEVHKNYNMFDEIFKEVKEFEELNILADANMKKIEKIWLDSKDCAVEDSIQSFMNLLTFTAMGAPADFKFFETKIPRKRYTTISDIWNGTLVYQSITGLYETRIKLKD